jgi:hypothetical protein
VSNQPFFQLDFGLPTGGVRGIVPERLATSRRTGPVQVAAINPHWPDDHVHRDLLPAEGQQ